MTLKMRQGECICECVCIRADDVEMDGMLWLPDDCIGLIVLAHGGSAARLKSSNDYVASVLRDARLGTLRVDLLTPAEARGAESQSLATRTQAGDAELPRLTARLGMVCEWVCGDVRTAGLSIGLFGIRRGAAAVLQLAAVRDGISAVVARGGRVDSAARLALAKVSAPTLLIAGGLDELQVKIHRNAYAALRCKKRFEVIPGATQLFDETGNLEVVARLARGWFLQHA